MKQIIFACGTEYHILVSYILASTTYRDHLKILLIYSNPRTSRYIKVAQQVGIWKDVYVINSEYGIEHYAELFDSLVARAAALHFFSWGFPEFNALYHRCAVVGVPIILTDEGIHSYSPMRRFGGWVSQNTKNLSLLNGFDLQKTQEIWLFEPSLFSEPRQWTLQQIPYKRFVDDCRKDHQLLEPFYLLFGLSRDIVLDADVIYFRQYFDAIGVLPPEVDAWLDEKIIGSFANTRLLIKNHPAHVNPLYCTLGGGFNGDDLPWEAILLLSLIDSSSTIVLPRVYCSLASSAMFKTVMLGVKGTFVFLNKIMEYYAIWNDDTLVGLIENLKFHYSDSTFLVPANWESLGNDLRTISIQEDTRLMPESLPSPLEDVERLHEFYLLNWRNNRLLQSRLDEQNQQRTSLQNQLSELGKQTTVLQAQLEECEQLATVFQMQLAESEQAGQALQKQLEEQERMDQALQRQLEEQEQLVTVLQAQLAKQEQSVSAADLHTTILQEELTNLKDYLNQREQILQDLNYKLLEIYSSTAWKIIQWMWKIRLWLAPKGSWREEFGRSLVSLLKKRPVFIRQSNLNLNSDIKKDKKEDRAPSGGIGADEGGDHPVLLTDYENVRLPWRKQAIERFFSLIHKQYTQNQHISHFILLPLFSFGGAEFVAMNFVRSILETKKDISILLIVTDRNIVDRRYEIPPNVIFLNLEEFLNTTDSWKKKIFVYDLVNVIKPSVIHNINSSTMWELIIEKGEEIRRNSKLYANIFCFQFNNDGTKTGYAEYYLRDAISYLDGLISDNQRFNHDAIVEYRLQSESKKFHTIYTPASITTVNGKELSIIRNRLDNYNDRLKKAKRLRCIWAGRLDIQKRWDLFISLVQDCSFCDFDMYGKSIVDEKPNMPDLPNLNFRGSFQSSGDVFLNNNYDAFIFTSQWEGLPTILLEAGIYGIPIVAPSVGGVGELVNNDTGYPLPEKPTIDDYVNALLNIKANPEEAAKRAKNMTNLILERHSWSSFIHNVNRLPGYLE